MFKLAPATWVAWQMIPGYVGERSVPYCSPIWIESVQPLKSEKGEICISFQNVMYAAGVQDFQVRLKVLKRAENYLVGELDDGHKSENGRLAVVSHIEFEWLRLFCPELWWHKPPSKCSSLAQSSVSMYLTEVFGGRAA